MSKAFLYSAPSSKILRMSSVEMVMEPSTPSMVIPKWIPVPVTPMEPSSYVWTPKFSAVKPLAVAALVGLTTPGPLFSVGSTPLRVPKVTCVVLMYESAALDMPVFGVAG